MSITFFVPSEPDAKVEEYDCFYCPDIEHAKPDCPDCKGTGKYVVYDRPHAINMSNTNALDFLSVLEIKADYCGEIVPDQFPKLKRKLISLINSYKQRSAFRADSFVDGNLIYFGRTDDYALDKARLMLELIQCAEDYKDKIVWG